MNKTHLLHTGGFLLLLLITQLVGVAIGALVGHFYPRMDASSVMASSLFIANGLGVAGYVFFKPQDVCWYTTAQCFRYPRLNYTWLSLMMAPAVIALVNILQDCLPELPNMIPPQQLKAIIGHPLGAFTICLLGPLCEEMLFRGGVQHTLQKMFSSGWRAVVVASLIFAMMHFNPAQMPGAFAIGLLLGWSYWRTGSIVPPFVIHVCNNSLVWLFPDATFTELLGGTEATVIVGCVAVLWLLVMMRQARRQLV